MRLKSYELVRDKFRSKAFPAGKPLGYEWNNLPRFVKPYYLALENQSANAANPEQIVMAANAASAPIGMRITHEGPFEGGYLMYDRDSVDSGACLIDLTDTHRRHRITARPCHVDTIMGDGTRPSIIPESIWIERRQNIQFQATDLTGAPNAIRPYIAGQRFFLEQARDEHLDAYSFGRSFRARYMLPYFAPTDKDIEMVGDDTLEWQFTQDGRGHFEVMKINYVSTGDFRFKIRDEVGTELTQNWVHNTAGLGTARDPFMTYGSWFITASGIVTFTIEDLSGTANKIYLTLLGRILFV